MATADEFEADDDFVDEEDTDDEDVDDADDPVDVVDAVDAVDLEVIGTFPVADDDDADDGNDDVPADAVVTPVADDGETDDEDGGPDLDEETDDVEEEEAEESLDVLLAREKAAAAEPDLGRLEEPRDGLSIPATPISAEEFTCRSCFLVKNRAQQAEPDQLICLDCA